MDDAMKVEPDSDVETQEFVAVKEEIDSAEYEEESEMCMIKTEPKSEHNTSFTENKHAHVDEEVCKPFLFVTPEDALNVTCKCRYSCRDLADMRAKLLEGYRALSLNEQGNYLMGLIDILPVRRRRHGNYGDPSESRRQSTVSFTIPDGQGNHRQVCKNNFMGIFGVSSSKIQTIVRKKKAGVTVYKDNRGGVKSFKFTLHDRSTVKEHIDSIPRERSHFNQHESGKEYMSSDLNVSRLYAAFKIKHPNSSVNYKFYHKVLLQDFPNVCFREARVDTCQTCDRFRVQPESKDEIEAATAEKQQEVHRRKAEKAFLFMKNDAIASALPDSDTCNVTIDLQKVFQIPKLTHPAMYYSQQLQCFNFGIHVSDTSDTIMCLWHEGQSSRGENQMASCLLRAINERHLTYKRNLSVWTDNCCGQFRNGMLLFLYIFLVATGLFERIDHKFLMVGHSFCASDRDFALIEKRWRATKVQVLEDVKKVITTARPSKPFRVLDMDGKFLNFDKAAKQTLDISKLKISKVSWLRVTKDNPGVVKYKESFSEIVGWETCCVFNRDVTAEDIVSTELEALPDVVPLPENRKKNLRSMVDFVDGGNKEFYCRISA